MARARTYLARRGLTRYGLDPERDAIVVGIAKPVTVADRARLRAAAVASPVNVILHAVNEDRFVSTLL